MAANSALTAIAGQLDPDETVLWSGRPNRSVLYRKFRNIKNARTQDIAGTVGFWGLLAFSVSALFSIIQFSHWINFIAFGVALMFPVGIIIWYVCHCLYLATEQYVVTSQRVFFVYTYPRLDICQVALESIPDPVKIENVAGDGIGDVILRTELQVADDQAVPLGEKEMRRVKICLFGIPNASGVLDLLNKQIKITKMETAKV